MALPLAAMDSGISNLQHWWSLTKRHGTLRLAHTDKS